MGNAFAPDDDLRRKWAGKGAWRRFHGKDSPVFAEFTYYSLRDLNASAAFNRGCGIEVLEAESGRVVLTMDWRPEENPYGGFMHAGVIGALIDTAGGFAAATMVGNNVLASHYSVNCLRPAVGERFTRASASREAWSLAGVYRVRTLCKRQWQGISGGDR